MIDLTKLIFFFVFACLPFLLCTIALLDIVKSRFHGYKKPVWIILVIILPYIGAITYFAVGTKTKDPLFRQ